jgi:hypothetical protein
VDGISRPSRSGLPNLEAYGAHSLRQRLDFEAIPVELIERRG